MTHVIPSLDWALCFAGNPGDFAQNLAVYRDYLEDQGYHGQQIEFIEAWLYQEKYLKEKIFGYDSVRLYTMNVGPDKRPNKEGFSLDVRIKLCQGNNYHYVIGLLEFFNFPQDRIPTCEDKEALNWHDFSNVSCRKQATLWEYGMWYCEDHKIPF